MILKVRNSFWTKSYRQLILCTKNLKKFFKKWIFSKKYTFAICGGLVWIVIRYFFFKKHAFNGYRNTILAAIYLNKLFPKLSFYTFIIIWIEFIIVSTCYLIIYSKSIGARIIYACIILLTTYQSSITNFSLKYPCWMFLKTVNSDSLLFSELKRAH